jgi:tartrate dehydrogenase/decarboxylase/D-malate dehydrogenase
MNHPERIYRIAVIPGDGIGREVVPVGVDVLRAAEAAVGGFRLELVEFPWGCEYYLQQGQMMPNDGIDQLRGFDAVLLGAVGWPAKVPDHISLWGLLLPIRKAFDQYANVRPCRLLPGVTGPLRDKGPDDINFVVVRENSEGEYSGVGGRVLVGTPWEVAVQDIVFTRSAVERIIRFAFELARREGRRRVTSVTKSNAMQFNMVFWDEVFWHVAADYPELAADQCHVDAMAARFIRNPEQLDVLVASNLFADILTDLAGAMQGSLGLSPSANVTHDRSVPSMFEPVHGSAPDIAGRGIANPIATIWAAAMMLDHLGEPDAAATIMGALERVTAERAALTVDLGGSASTTECGDAVIRALRATPAMVRGRG